jgi:hypothetical protein
MWNLSVLLSLHTEHKPGEQVSPCGANGEWRMTMADEDKSPKKTETKTEAPGLGDIIKGNFNDKNQRTDDQGEPVKVTEEVKE